LIEQSLTSPPTQYRLYGRRTCTTKQHIGSPCVSRIKPTFV